MPVAIPLVGLAVTAGMGGLQMAQANKQKKAAQKAIDGYKRQDLSNPYGALSVSTLGADRQREDLARTMSSFTNTIASGGSRLAAATLPNLLEQQNNQEAQIAANLDQQQAQINQMNAGGQMQVQGIQEQRENADLAGLGTQLDLANANAASAKNSFISGIANGLTNVASAGLSSMQQGNGFFGQTPKSTAFNSNLHNNLSARLPTTLQAPNPGLSNNNTFSFGNNINGFAYSNQNLPIFGYKKLF